MSLLQQIVARAKADKQRIVLPEAEEERTLKAADRALALVIPHISRSSPRNGDSPTSTRPPSLTRSTIPRARSMQPPWPSSARRRA